MSQIYQLSEVAVNNGKNGKPVWLIIKGNVYDVTDFVKGHPGGDELILEVAGKDATKAFNSAGHSPDAVKDLKQYKIGELAISTQPKAQEAADEKTNPKLPQKSDVEPKKSGGFLCCC